MAVPEGYVALDLVGFTDKGTYSGAAVYMKNDLVHKDNVIWRCIADNTQAVPPAAGENWEKWIEGSAQMSGCTAVDTEGMIGAENSVVVAQSLIDAIADKVMNDLVAKTQIVNNLLATVTGNVLDATQGKVLDDKITQLNGNLTGLNAETESLASDIAALESNENKNPNQDLVSGNTILGWFSAHKNESRDAFSVSGNYPSDAPEQAEGYIEFKRGTSGNRTIVFFYPYDDSKQYYYRRSIFQGSWKGEWKKYSLPTPVYN